MRFCSCTVDIRMDAKETPCVLVPGLQGVLVQVILMFLAVLTLFMKKQLENRSSQRSWSEFVLDSSKQIFGAFWIHVLNLFFAVRLHRTTAQGDQCDWYFVNIIVDCTVGTAIEYALFFALNTIIIPRMCSTEFVNDLKTGEYGDKTFSEIRLGVYIKQLSLWLLICTVMKIFIYSILKTYRDIFVTASRLILSCWNEEPNRKLIIVMILTPLLFNTLQLWIVDNFIKKRPYGKTATSMDARNLLGYSDFFFRYCIKHQITRGNIYTYAIPNAFSFRYLKLESTGKASP